MTSRRDDSSLSAVLRHRRLVSSFRRLSLYHTAHALERETCVFFDAAHLRRMLLRGRWAAASSYALRFIDGGGNRSRSTNMLRRHIIVFRVIADLAAGRRNRDLDALFRSLHDSLYAHRKTQALQRLLLSLRSDHTKASWLYQSTKDKAIDNIMYLVSKCPELNAKTRLPRCTFDPANIMSLGPRLRRRMAHYKNKTSSIPAHSLALSFLSKRPPEISHMANHSGKQSRHHDASYSGSSEQLVIQE